MIQQTPRPAPQGWGWWTPAQTCAAATGRLTATTPTVAAYVAGDQR
jgi:hypothetical protein